jgi:4-hydroxybenzoate polyprenyltransferase
VLAATVIAGGDPLASPTVLSLFSMTLFYVGGMYLNDAFDRGIDARERPQRPIPSGEITASVVFAIGFSLLGAAVVLIALARPAALIPALALCATIVFYDAFHKANPLSPLVMSGCRLLVYVGAASAAVGFVPTYVWLAGLALAAHVIGLTYAAKREALNRIDRVWPVAILIVPLAAMTPAAIAHWQVALIWMGVAVVDGWAVRKLMRRASPDAVPAAVAMLIAAISLVDALLVAPISLEVAVICLCGYAATRLAQRMVPGT